MASTVVGLFDDLSVAERVYRELENSGIRSDALYLISYEQTDLSNWSTESRNWDRGQFGHDIIDRLTSLSVPQDDAELYSEGVRRGGSLVVAHVDDESVGRATEIMNRYKPVDIHARADSWRRRGFSGYDRTSTPYSRDQVQQEREHIAREERITIAEEDVKIGKREVSRGGVRVHSHVVSRPVEEQVRLRDERVDVERRQVDRPLTDADRAFQDRTIEMREMDEEAVVSKDAHVTGEVVVRKGAEEHTETVRETVRKTEVDVEDLAGGRERGGRFEDVSNEFRSHSNASYGSDAWNTYEPAYRWGYMSGSSERYRGRDFSEAEPDLRRDYEERQGRGTWDRVKEAIRHAFNRAQQ